MKRIIPSVLLLAGTGYSCGNGTEPATTALTDADARIIADMIVDQASVPSAATSTVDLVLLQTAPPTGPFTINNTLSCSGSGTTAVTGSGNRASNTTTRVATVTWSAAASHTNCRLTRESRTFTFTAGTIQIQGNATYQMPAQQGGQPTVQTFQLSRSGTVTIASERFNGGCTINIATNWVAAEAGYRTTGTVCDRNITSTTPPRGFPNTRVVPGALQLSKKLS